MANKLFNTNVIAAARSYLYRQGRIENPVGSYDKSGRWYPEGKDEEVMAPVRSPSRSFPYSYLKAALTIKHCAALRDADEKEVRRVLKLVGNPPPLQNRAQLQEWVTGALDQYALVPSLETTTSPAISQRVMGRL